MAYDTLKAEIRQYIKTNGANEITGQILQNVLLDMVNAYPSLDGYATQQWVQNQLSDMATQTWVGQNYLALTGGTMRNNNGNTNTILPNKIKIMYSDTDLDVDTSLELLPGELRFVESDEEYISVYKNSTQLRFALEEGGFANLYAGSFVKSGGTSSQFLKADGSVDSNTYLTSSAISDMATQTWVGQNYLALTGGTMRNNNGNTNTILPNKIKIMYSDTDLDVDTSLELLPGELRFVESDEEYISVYKNSTQLRFALEEGGFANLYAGSFIQTSDIRRKNIISDISMAIDDIAKAPMFRFTMKDDDEGIVRVGTSAQYWQTVIPEVVSEDKRGVLGLQYDVAALAGVITVAKRVVDHEQRIAELEKENALLKAKLNIN